jgi:pterin-4a-carbinolamine dehydratase
MNNYFNKDERRPFVLSENSLPVKTKQSLDWDIVPQPNRYRKKFKFSKRSQMANFLNDLFSYEDELQHHAEITVRYKTVTVEVWTHSLEDITEVDGEYARMANEIYKDNYASLNE